MGKFGGGDLRKVSALSNTVANGDIEILVDINASGGGRTGVEGMFWVIAIFL